MIKMIKNSNRYRMYLGFSFVAAAWMFFASLTFTGCSSLTDAPPQTKQAEQDVRNYFILLNSKGAHYDYVVTSTSSFYPASDTLGMDMQGVGDTLNYVPIYSCLWTYKNFDTPTLWYYGLTDKKAISYGMEDGLNTYTDSWVDLQAPLDDTAHWTFTSWGEQITASVVKYGATAQVNGKTYSDVVMVQYTGANGGTTGTEWFARGVGIIFSHIERPGSGIVQNQLQDVIQK